MGLSIQQRNTIEQQAKTAWQNCKVVTITAGGTFYTFAQSAICDFVIDAQEEGSVDFYVDGKDVGGKFRRWRSRTDGGTIAFDGETFVPKIIDEAPAAAPAAAAAAFAPTKSDNFKAAQAQPTSKGANRRFNTPADKLVSEFVNQLGANYHPDSPVGDYQDHPADDAPDWAENLLDAVRQYLFEISNDAGEFEVYAAADYFGWRQRNGLEAFDAPDDERVKILKALADNDKNGCFTDLQAWREGEKPLTLELAKELEASELGPQRDWWKVTETPERWHVTYGKPHEVQEVLCSTTIGPATAENIANALYEQAVNDWHKTK